MLQEKIGYKDRDLTNLAMELTRKHEFANQVISKLHDIKPEDQETNKDISQLVQFIKNNILVDRHLNELQSNIGDVNQQFFKNLSTKYDQLTQNDLQICGFLRLGLNNKEISVIKNVTPKAIRTSKYRIRMKIGLTEELQLIDFLLAV